MPPAMNQFREAVSIPVESRMSPRTPRKSSRSPQTEHKPNAMNPAYMLTMARPIASNLSAVPSDASPQLRPSCTRALNRAADTPAHVMALIGAGACLGLPPWLWPCRWSGRPPATLVQRRDALVRLRSVAEHYFRQHAEVGE